MQFGTHLFSGFRCSSVAKSSRLIIAQTRLNRWFSMTRSSKLEIKSQEGSARTGAFKINHESYLQTPCMIIPTSRGAVPHLTPDVINKHVDIPALYVGMEDFADHKAEQSPLYSFREKGNLRDFIRILPRASDGKDVPLFFSARRSNPIPTSQANSDSNIAIVTNDGFRQLKIEEFLDFTESVGDSSTIIVAPVDTPTLIAPTNASSPDLADRAKGKIGGNRMRKMISRNELWSVATLKRAEKTGKSVIVPIIPGVPVYHQAMYLERIMMDSDVPRPAGFSVLDLASPFLDINHRLSRDEVDRSKPDRENPQLTLSLTLDFSLLPPEMSNSVRLNLGYLTGPHEVLEAVSLGYDLLCGDWIANATDAGIAMTFSFGESSIEGIIPEIGLNMWDTEKYCTDMTSFKDDCKCYACVKHQKAYVAHLLNAKEMLAWTLLQIHNIATVNLFMGKIRESIAAGTFEMYKNRFFNQYPDTLSSLGSEIGQGLRVRGYQVKLAGGPTEKKLNESPYKQFDDCKE
ncbi:tRNA-guanine(15) transglycosylase-like protein [Dipodascopsis uninucleata]